MLKSIKPIQRLVEQLEGLPGVGPKTAQRLAYYMLRYPQDRLDRFSDAVAKLKRETKLCDICFNVDTESPCLICSDLSRNEKVLCVVETPLDLLAIERSGKYNGLYHCLHGVINPLNNIGPSDIYLPQLLKRIEIDDLEELILATNPSMEGESTSMYIHNKVKEMGKKIKVTRIGRGLPTGADLEYADEITVFQAMEGRREM